MNKKKLLQSRVIIFSIALAAGAYLTYLNASAYLKERAELTENQTLLSSMNEVIEQKDYISENYEAVALKENQSQKNGDFLLITLLNNLAGKYNITFDSIETAKDITVTGRGEYKNLSDFIIAAEEAGISITSLQMSARNRSAIYFKLTAERSL